MNVFYAVSKRFSLMMVVVLFSNLGLWAQVRKDVIFKINDLSGPMYDTPNKDKLHTLPQLLVQIKGDIQEECFLMVGNTKIPCTEVQQKGKYRISHQANAGDTFVSPPYELYVKYGNDDSFHIGIGKPSNGQSVTGQSEEQKQKDQKEQEYIRNRLQGPPIVWRDALELLKAIDNGSANSINAILENYYMGTGKYTYAAFLNGLENNFYLKTILPTPSELKRYKVRDSSKFNADKDANAELGIGLFDPTIALQALDTLIWKRLIDELNMAYLNNFREAFNSTELGKLLPNTSTLLLQIGTTYSFDYKSLLPNLRKTLDKDLEALPKNGRSFIAENQGAFCDGDNCNEYVLLYTILQIAEDVIDKDQLEDILGQFKDLDFKLTGTRAANSETVIKFISTISNHLRKGPQTGNWIDFEQLFSSPLRISSFIGLLIELEKTNLQNWKIDNQSLYQLITDKASPRYTSLLKLTYNVFSLVEESTLLLEEINEDKSREEKLEVTFTTIERILDLLSELPEDLNFVARPSNDPNVKTAIEAAKIVLHIVEDIANKDYVTAVTQLSHLLKLSSVDAETHEKLLKYITFAQNLIDAKDRDELLAALENAADPVGSYRHKRTLPLTVSVTAFPGLTFGREKYTSGVNNNTAINNLGFTAPLGLALSFSGATGPQDNKASLTFFAPILDVGAVTTFRLNNDSAEIPELKWENFFAPGLIAQYGFKNSPMSVYFGFQYGPSASSTLTQITRLPRFNAGISVDLHLYSIYNKPKKQKAKTPTPKKPKTK